MPVGSSLLRVHAASVAVVPLGAMQPAMTPPLPSSSTVHFDVAPEQPVCLIGSQSAGGGVESTPLESLFLLSAPASAFTSPPDAVSDVVLVSPPPVAVSFPA